jgi:peptidoglycan/xylan/chitin deacetylase (PgdA/CDA1 family)
MKAELVKTIQLIESTTGQKSLLFRPPFGVTNPRIAKAVKQLKLLTIGWSIRSYDTVSKNEEAIANRILRKLKPGAIVLLHDNLPNTASTLDKVLAGASAQKLVCLDIPTFLKTSNSK